MRIIPRMRHAPCWAAILLVLGCSGAHGATDSVVTINEVMYHPPDPVPPETVPAPEWIELHNPMSIRVDVGGWSLRGGVAFTFPEGTVMEPGAHLVVSAVAVPTSIAPVMVADTDCPSSEVAVRPAPVRKPWKKLKR